MTIPIAMLDERIRVHDALQLEFRQRLPFPEGGRANRYTSETFMYIPASLNINRLTFPKSHFYRSLKNYIRLQGPSFTLAQLAAPGGLLEKLQEYAARFPTFFDAATFSADDKKHLAAQEQTAKAFSMAFQRSLLEKTRSLTRWGKAGAIAAFAGEIREIMNQVWALGKGCGGDVPPYLDAMKEYCSDQASSCGLLLLRSLEKKPEGGNGGSTGEDPDLPRAREALVALIELGAKRRAAIAADSTPDLEGDNEAYMARRQALKRYMNSPLFLEIRSKREGALVQHVAYGIAAALSMIFATLIAFVWQARYGAISAPLFAALVVSYIFKDRLKDILREYMNSLFRRRVSDRGLVIYQGLAPLGRCREIFDFMEQRHVPPEVRAMREVTAHELPFLSPYEEIMYYRKRIWVRPMITPGADARGIVDITRIDLSELVRNMDGTRESIPALDTSGGTPRCRLASGIKTYPVHVVRRYAFDGMQSCTAFRLIMDHTGIRRIERLCGTTPVDEEPEGS